MIISSINTSWEYKDDNIHTLPQYINIPSTSTAFFFHCFALWQETTQTTQKSWAKKKTRIFYDIVRKKKFLVSLSSYSDQDLYTFLLGMYQKDYINATYQGELPNFPTTHIKTQEELYKRSITLAWFNQYSTYHTLSLISPMRIQKNISWGWTSKDKNISKEIAISEILERLCLNDKTAHPQNISQKITNSNGMACHITLEKAILNSKREYIERDNLLLSRILKKNIHPLSHVSETKEREQKCHCNISHFVLTWDTPGQTLLTIRIDRENGKLIDINCISWNNIYALIEKNHQESCKIDILRQKENEYADDQQSFLIQQRNNTSINVHDIQNASLKDFEREVETYQRHTVHFQHPLLQTFDRYCIRSTSPDLLHLYFEEKIPQSILNHPRLLHRQKVYWITEINTTPHPLTSSSVNK